MLLFHSLYFFFFCLLIVLLFLSKKYLSLTTDCGCIAFLFTLLFGTFLAKDFESMYIILIGKNNPSVICKSCACKIICIYSLKITIIWNAVFHPISGHRWCKKKLSANFSTSVLISRIKHFSISIRCSWVD